LIRVAMAMAAKNAPDSTVFDPYERENPLKVRSCCFGLFELRSGIFYLALYSAYLSIRDISQLYTPGPYFLIFGNHAWPLVFDLLLQSLMACAGVYSTLVEYQNIFARKLFFLGRCGIAFLPLFTIATYAYKFAVQQREVSDEEKLMQAVFICSQMFEIGVKLYFAAVAHRWYSKAAVAESASLLRDWRTAKTRALSVIQEEEIERML